MNYARIALSAVVAFVVSIPVGFLVNDVLLKGLYDANRTVMRADAAVMANLPIGFVFLLIGFLAFAYAYAKGYEGGSGAVEGLRFGATVGLVVLGFGIVWQYVLYPITISMAIAIMVDSFVELCLYGAIVGAVYKPVAVAAKRPVTV